MMTGPLAPLSNKPTRRRIKARIISRQVGDDGFALFRSTTLCDFYFARKYDDQARRNVARSYNAFSRFIKLRLAETAKAIDVRLRHRGKHLVPPGAKHRKGRLRHGHPSTISRCPFDRTFRFQRSGPKRQSQPRNLV